MQIICSECGQPFDESQCCYVCIARDGAIEVAFYIAFAAAVFVLPFGSLLAFTRYPSISSGFLLVYAFPCVSSAVTCILAFLLLDRLTRYWIFVIVFFILVAITFVIPPAYYILNGFLDAKPPTAITAQVVGKHDDGPEGGGPYVDMSVPLNHERILVSVWVNDRTFDAAKPGDSAHMSVHPGAFSVPWYDDVYLE